MKSRAVLLLLLTAACAHTPARLSVEAATLKDWALSRCISKAAKGQAFSRDAELVAGAFLERGNVKDFSTYERLEQVADAFLARRYGGSVPGEYQLLKCIDLYHSAEVDRLVRDAK